MLGRFSAVMVGCDLAFIKLAPFRVCQVFNIVSNGNNHLIGYKSLFHKIKRKKVCHLPDNELRLLKLIRTVKHLS